MTLKETILVAISAVIIEAILLIQFHADMISYWFYKRKLKKK